MRFSITTLFTITAVAAIGIVSLRQGDWFWSRVVFLLALVIQLTALASVLLCSGRRRAFWIGFAVFGWAHWLIMNHPSMQVAEYNMFVREIIKACSDIVPEASDGLVISPGDGGLRIAIFSFNRTVVSLFGLLFALLGGLISLWMHDADQKQLAIRNQVIHTDTR